MSIIKIIKKCLYNISSRTSQPYLELPHLLLSFTLTMKEKKKYRKTVVIKLIFRGHLQYHIFAFTPSDSMQRNSVCQMKDSLFAFVGLKPFESFLFTERKGGQ